jgi:hypothetical protein
VGEHPVEVGDRGGRFAQQTGQLGEDDAAEVGGQAGLLGDGAIQLAEGRAEPAETAEHGLPAGQPRLKDAFQRGEERLVRAGRGALAEVRVALLVLAGGQQLRRQHDDGAPSHSRPAHRLLQGVDLQVARGGKRLHFSVLPVVSPAAVQRGGKRRGPPPAQSCCDIRHLQFASDHPWQYRPVCYKMQVTPDASVEKGACGPR